MVTRVSQSFSELNLKVREKNFSLYLNVISGAVPGVETDKANNNFIGIRICPSRARINCYFKSNFMLAC